MTSQRKIALLRRVTLVLLCRPAAEIAWRQYVDRLGPLPVGQATLATGDWTVILLLLSLALTPARGVFEWPPLIQIRRRMQADRSPKAFQFDAARDVVGQEDSACAPGTGVGWSSKFVWSIKPSAASRLIWA